MVWAILFAHCYGVRLALNEIVILCLTVWLIYVGDRLLDGWRPTELAALQLRHFFCAEHRNPFICIGLIAAFVDLSLITKTLGSAELFAGLKLAAIVGIYLLSVHVNPRIARSLPKELAVGILFAAGTALPVCSKNSASSVDWEFSVGLFALLCSLNCFSIEYWERNGSKFIDRLETKQILGGTARISEAAAGLAVVALALPFFDINGRPPTAVALAVSLSAWLIFSLNYFRDRLSLSALRVLVDLVLVVAALVALIIRI